MPLPWQPGKRAVFIDDITQRAVTVTQIYDLRLFLQQLCKCQLLRQTSTFARLNDLLGRRLDWHNIDLYQITDEVISKVIPHVDPSSEHGPQEGRRYCSWAEFVASGPQPADFMVSHWWGGRFRDFTTTIGHVVADKGLSKSTAFWICTFANNQWGEDLGEYLEQCAFVKTLSTVDALVLVVDRVAGSLSRSWCCLEIYHASKFEKDLLVYTSAGEVGSKMASCGPLVEAVKRWDVRRSEATEPAYRRQILNFIAGIKQTSGLQVDSTTGGLCMPDGRPVLETEDIQEHVRRKTGDLEYKHEASLFAAHGDRFDELNMTVRLSVMAKIGLSGRTRGCTIEHFAQRGITLGQIRSFWRKLESSCKEFEPPVSFEDLDLHTALAKFIKPSTKTTNGRLGQVRSCSYVEMVADKPLVPTIYLDYAFKMKILDVFHAIEWFAEAMQLQDSAAFFWDLLAYNQHEIGNEIRNTKFNPQTGSLAFDPAQYECDTVLACVEGNSFLRAWPAHVWESASRLGQHFYIACRDGVMACSAPFPGGSAIFGAFDEGIAQHMFDFRVQALGAWDPMDKTAILKWLSEHPVSGADGPIRLERRVQHWSVGPLLRAAAENDDSAAVERICSSPGLAMNSPLLAGHQGESAVHVAAAAGSLGALKNLLTSKMDPNNGDSIDEKPLHYAAMAGQAEAAKYLMVARADLRCESRFGETAMDIARQGGASFLPGVDTSDVIRAFTDC